MKKILNRIKNLDNKNKKKLLLLLVLFFVLVVSSISYAFYMFSDKQDRKNEISSACFKITL